MKKVCTKCKKEKEISEFPRNKTMKDEHNCWCKECVNLARRQNHKDNRKRDNLYSRQYHKDHPEAYKKYQRIHYREIKSKHFMKHYNINHEQYDEMLLKQNGYCVICGKHQSEFDRAFGVDHNHVTGEVRSLLCINCNQGIGAFKENISIMQNAIDYLNKMEKE